MNKIHFNYIFELMGYILHQSNEVSLITPLSTLGCNLIHLAKLQTSFYPALASIGIQMMDILFKIHSSSNTSKKRKRESESTFTTTVQEAAFTRYLKIFSDQPKVKHHLTSLLVAYSQHTQSLDQLFLREAVFVVLAKCSQFEKERALCCGDKRVIKYLVDLFESHIKFRGKA